MLDIQKVIENINEKLKADTEFKVYDIRIFYDDQNFDVSHKVPYIVTGIKEIKTENASFGNFFGIGKDGNGNTFDRFGKNVQLTLSFEVFSSPNFGGANEILKIYSKLHKKFFENILFLESTPESVKFGSIIYDNTIFSFKGEVLVNVLFADILADNSEDDNLKNIYIKGVI